MPKTQKQLTTIYTSLTSADCTRFDMIARSKGLSRSETAREALRWYTENQEQLVNDERDAKLERRIKKMEDRLAGIMARTAIDVGVIYTLIWRNLPEANRADVLKSAYTQAVNRLKQKMSEKDSEVKELVKQ